METVRHSPFQVNWSIARTLGLPLSIIKLIRRRLPASMIRECRIDARFGRFAYAAKCDLETISVDPKLTDKIQKTLQNNGIRENTTVLLMTRIKGRDSIWAKLGTTYKMLVFTIIEQSRTHYSLTWMSMQSTQFWTRRGYGASIGAKW
jgi:hypothetical protein